MALFLTSNYYVDNGIIINDEDEPVNVDLDCNCDLGYQCSNPECIDGAMRDAARCGRVATAWNNPAWLDYLAIWRKNKAA